MKSRNDTVTHLNSLAPIRHFEKAAITANMDPGLPEVLPATSSVTFYGEAWILDDWVVYLTEGGKERWINKRDVRIIQDREE